MESHFATAGEGSFFSDIFTSCREASIASSMPAQTGYNFANQR